MSRCVLPATKSGECENSGELFNGGLVGALKVSGRRREVRDTRGGGEGRKEGTACVARPGWRGHGTAAPALLLLRTSRTGGGRRGEAELAAKFFFKKYIPLEKKYLVNF